MQVSRRVREKELGISSLVRISNSQHFSLAKDIIHEHSMKVKKSFSYARSRNK